MAIYIIVILLMFLLSIAGVFLKKKALTIIILSANVLVAVLFCALKSDAIGPDTIEYHKMFDNFANKDLAYCFQTKTEVGFSLFTKLITYFSKSFVFYNFVFYFVVWFSFAFFSYSASKEPAVCFALVFSFSLQFALTAYRQILAVSMIAVAMALYATLKRKWLRIILFCLFFTLGLSFHHSAIVCLTIPVAFVVAKKTQIKPFLCVGLYVAFLSGVRCIYYLIAEITNTVYVPFIRNSIPYTSLMAFFVFMLSYLLNFSRNFRLKNSECILDRQSKETQRLRSRFVGCIYDLFAKDAGTETEDTFLKSSTLLALIAACTMSFSLITTVITRIYVYFEAAIAFVIIETIASRKKKIIRILSYIMVMLFAVAYFYISIKRSGYLDFYVPYETFF